MKATQGQLMLSIGALLASEREKRGIPVERAAKETRMRPQRIRDMEADDLSHFTNPSYARMFLIAYAKYLGIPMQTIRDHLPDRGEPGTEGYQYIHAAAEELPSLRPDLATRPAKRRLALQVLIVATVVVILAGAGILGTYLVVNVNRLTAVVNKPPPTPEPTPAEAPPKPVTAEDIGLTNILPGAKAPETFEKDVQLAAPPAPTPPTVALAEKPASTPEPAVSSATAQPSPSATDDDRAFLLGSSPEQSPPTVR
jgi:cytoskeletal protein RodZ